LGLGVSRDDSFHVCAGLSRVLSWEKGSVRNAFGCQGNASITQIPDFGKSHLTTMHNSAPLKKTEFQHSSNLSKIFSSSQNIFQNNSQDIWIANEILLNVFAFLQPDSGANTQMKTWNVHPALRLRIADLVWITFPRQNRTHRHPSEPYGFPSFTGALVSLLPLF